MGSAINQSFTPEQLEELQLDSALGGDIPFVGLGATLFRKGAIPLMEKLAASAKHLVKSGDIDEAVTVFKRFKPFEGSDSVETLADKAKSAISKFSHVTTDETAKKLTEDQLAKEILARAAVAVGTTVAVSITAANYFSKDVAENAQPTAKNIALSQQFTEAIKSSRTEPNALQKLATEHPELARATAFYKITQTELEKDGDLSSSDYNGLNLMAEKISLQIKNQGPESFSSQQQERDLAP